MDHSILFLRKGVASLSMGIAILGLAERCSPITEVVVNEVMANVKGSEVIYGKYNEFVELFNVSGQPVDLAGWSISDGDAVDMMVAWNDSLGVLNDSLLSDTYILPGGTHCLILDRDYAKAPDSSGYTPYHIRPGTVILTTMNSTIGNGLSSTDPIILLDNEGDTVDTYGTPADGHDALPFDPGDGTSVERVFPTVGDEESNWLACVRQSGCTPGDQNSVTPYVGVGLSWEDMEIEPWAPEPGKDAEIKAALHNRSMEVARGVDVTFYVDSDGDGYPGGDEVIDVSTVESIGPLNGEAEVTATWTSIRSGCHLLGVQVLGTVSAFRMTRAGRGPGFVVVNEIMYDPDAGGEWIELHNSSPHRLNMRGWRLRDEGRSCTISEKDLALDSGGFLVICADSTQFFSRYPLFDGVLLEPGGFPSLNNSGDLLILSDLSDFTLDSFYYESEWGGGEGISLERVNPSYSSEERANWSGSVDTEGATPGEKNSIYAPVRLAETTMGIAPNPFSPDGDGRDDCTAISYALPFAVAQLRVIVYDRRGRIVRQILPGNHVASSGAVLWDGRDDSGNLLPLGVYLVYLDARDVMSGASVCSRSTAVLARRLN